MAAYHDDPKDTKDFDGEVIVLQVPWKGQTRRKKITLAARIIQVRCRTPLLYMDNTDRGLLRAGVVLRHNFYSGFD